MQRQRGELVPIAEALADLPGPVKALRRDRPPQRGFTLADQVDQLAAAREADPGRGFMARTMALCSLPRSNPGNRTQYKRANRPYTLVMSAAGVNKLPFGNLPRLILAWICTEVVKTQSREVVLGKSLANFMRSLGVYSSSGGKYTRLRNQMNRLFNCSVSMIYKDDTRRATVNAVLADLTAFWWNPKQPDQAGLWESKVRLSESFFNEIIRHPVPIDMNTLKALKRSPLGLDLYLWLVYRTFTLRTPQRITWRQVYRQFGLHPDKASDKRTVDAFRTDCLRELKKIKLAWPDLNYTTPPGVLILLPSVPHISLVPEPGPALISS